MNSSILVFGEFLPIHSVLSLCCETVHKTPRPLAVTIFFPILCHGKESCQEAIPSFFCTIVDESVKIICTLFQNVCSTIMQTVYLLTFQHSAVFLTERGRSSMSRPRTTFDVFVGGCDGRTAPSGVGKLWID